MSDKDTITTSPTENRYSYKSNGWKDQLLSYNGEECKYDEIGNPETYRGKSLTWGKVRNLEKIGTTINYKYNANGIRTSKKVNNVTTKFYLKGNKIVAQDDGNKVYFHYGVDGLVGFTYRVSDTDIREYYYKTDILGNIIGIYDENMNLIVKYIYDAWGNHKTYVLCSNNYIEITTSNTTTEFKNNKTIAELNPFRYHSYYYDEESKLYYLNSRYYDPETGRFINADDISIFDTTKSVINGLNLFAYCGNNPVMYTDPSGHAFISALLISIGIAALIGGSTAGVSAYQSGKHGWDLVSDIAGGAIFGAAVGATISLGGAAGLAATGVSVAGFGLSTSVSLGISIGATAVAGMAKYSLNCIASNENDWNFGGFILSGIEGALQGASTFGFAFFGGKYGLFNKLGNFKTADAFYINHGVMNVLSSVFWGSKVLIGETFSKALFVSGFASLVRWLIDLMIPNLY